MCHNWHLYLVHSLSGISTVYDVLHLGAGVFIRTRSDGKLFQLARQRSSTKPREYCICELLLPDDDAIVAYTLEDIAEFLNNLNNMYLCLASQAIYICLQRKL